MGWVWSRRPAGLSQNMAPPLAVGSGSRAGVPGGGKRTCLRGCMAVPVALGGQRVSSSSPSGKQRHLGSMEGQGSQMEQNVLEEVAQLPESQQDLATLASRAWTGASQGRKKVWRTCSLGWTAGQRMLTPLSTECKPTAWPTRYRPHVLQGTLSTNGTFQPRGLGEAFSGVKTMQTQALLAEPSLQMRLCGVCPRWPGSEECQKDHLSRTSPGQAPQGLSGGIPEHTKALLNGYTNVIFKNSPISSSSICS